MIIRAYARIVEPLARFRILSRAYSDNAEIQQTLAVFYSDILGFHNEAYKFVRRSGKFTAALYVYSADACVLQAGRFSS